MFTLAISCLTTSNLPWFMALTFQVPWQYYSLQHQTLLPSKLTSTTGCCFCFGSISSSFLEWFFHSSPIGYWAPTDLGSSSFSVMSFCLFLLLMGVLKARRLKCLPFPSPVHHVLSELPPWPIRLGWPYTAWLIVLLSQTRMWSMWSDWLVFSDCGFQSVCPLKEKDKKGLWCLMNSN